ncbi:MAG: potassium/proton antiporter [Anaerovoracaceae bacterium]
MHLNILIVAIILLLCLLLNKISSKLGIPMLLAFILLGMVFGSDGIFKIYFDNYKIAEQVCSAALIFIMFYGGFGTNLKAAKPVAVKSLFLSTLGVIFTATLTGLFCYYVLHMHFLESMLLGSIISSTDAASVFSILRSKKLNLKYNTASMLEIESGSNDPFSYMLTIIVLSLMTGDFSSGNLILMIFAQIAFGILVGFATAAIGDAILSKHKFTTDGFDSIFVFALALIAFAGASVIGGNGYLSVYIAGIILGDKPLNNKKALVHFFDGVTGLTQMLIFFLLGLLSFPSNLVEIWWISLAIALFLTFVARPIAVFAILSPCRCSFKQKLLVSWAGLRGAASIVFAIVAVASPVPLENDIFHIVFFIVLFSISIQGSLIGIISKLLDMIDNDVDVMETFNDYSDGDKMGFIETTVDRKHKFYDKKINGIKLIADLEVALVMRKGVSLPPSNDLIIESGDTVILSSLNLTDEIKQFVENL